MKKILTISLLTLLTACSAPSKVPEPGSPGETVSIAYLKTLYKGAPVAIAGELRISGRVVGSDVKGNFYKTLVLDDGTGGIEVKLDLEEIFKYCMIDTRVTVRCNGLWLGSYGGTLQLGDEPLDGWQTRHIPEGDIPLHIQPDDSYNKPVIPRRLVFGALSAEHISSFVCFEGVQFIDEEDGFGWAETDSETDTDRHLVDAVGDTLIVRTSRYALFAHKVLPHGNGYIEGVLGYFNGSYQLRVSDDQKAVMNGGRF